MEQEAMFKGSWRSEHNSINVKLPLILFEEGNNQIVYCPALEIAGYGKDEAEARNSFKVSLGEFFLYTTNKNTLTGELQRLGWKVKGKHKPAYPPSMHQLLENNENFKRIFDQHPFRKVDEQFEIPVA